MVLKFLYFSKTCYLVVALLTGAGVSQVLQAETLPIFGVRLAMADANFSSLDTSVTSGHGLVLGVTSTTYRIYADLNFYTWDAAKTRTIHANYDYIWQVSEFWQPFMGVYGGLVDLELDVAKNYQSGASVGVQGGVLFPLGKSGWQVETGARYGGFGAKLFNPATQQDEKLKSQAEAFVTFSFSS